MAVTLGPIVSQELEYRGSYRFVSEIEDAVSLLARTDLAEAVITHVVDLEEAHAAFTTAATDPSSGKVVLRLS